MPLDRVFEVLAAAHAAGRLEPAMKKVWGANPGDRSMGVWPGVVSRISRARAALVMGDATHAAALAEVCRHLPDRVHAGPEPEPEWPVLVFGNHPDPAWLPPVSDGLLVEYAKAIGRWASSWLGPLPERTVSVLLTELEGRKLSRARRYPVELLRGAILQLAPDVSAPLVALRGHKLRRQLEMLHAFIRGDYEETFALGVDVIGSRIGARPKLDELEYAAFLVACVEASRRGVSEAWPVFSGLVEPMSPSASRRTPRTVQVLSLMVEHERGLMEAPEIVERLDQLCTGRVTPWPVLFVGGLVVAWLDLVPTLGLVVALEKTARAAREVIRAPAIPETLEASTTSSPEPGGLVGSYRPRPAWQPLVEQLQELADRVSNEGPGTADEAALPYILWQLGETGRHPAGSLGARPRLVTSVRAPMGRAVGSLDLLKRHYDVASTQDTVVATLFSGLLDRQERYREPGRGGPGRLSHLDRYMLLGLIGHPRVVDARGRPVEVVRGSARLTLEEDGDEVRVRVEPVGLADWPIAYEWEDERRLAVVQRDETTASVLRALASLRGEVVTREALTQLRPALAKLAGHLTIVQRGDVDLEAPPVEPRTSIDVDLEWVSETLTVEIGVRPLGADGPRCIAAAGSRSVVAELDGSQRSVLRNLEAEARAVQKMLAACPSLRMLTVDYDGVRFVNGLEPSCDLLQELIEAARAGLCSLGWPRGKPLRLHREYGPGDFRIRVSAGGHDWLRVVAGLELDEGEVLTWRRLVEHTRGVGRYVRLADGRVLELSAELRRRLEHLEQLDGAAGTKRRDSDELGLAIPQVVLPALTELLGEGEALELDGEVAERQREIERALALCPPVPRTLQATLRGYQREGFRWMSRLAAAGMGAVLADDMGLGKTLQALALLLARRSEGPALVVCPTSVAGNWCVEAARFAPSLDMVDLGDMGPHDRLETLRALGPGQVAVMSYGVLSRLDLDGDPPRLATVVFDEAHALKNARASRTRAALRLAADFRLGLTGTPIENHLGELWSVMNVCVPGLLGDEDWFTHGLARAIEGGSQAATDQLRALIRPFLLRRTKAMVLAELPECVDATVMVEPTRKERAWYEAQRRLAEERVAEAARQSRDLQRGQSRILMLTEIGRLRRAAVDPRLLDDRAPKGAKLELVVDRAGDLVEAGHQVLVFTQFLDVIQVLAARLGERGVRTLELQGSTPASERDRRIDAFQAGEADVFLMSLKAGGVGVNLTAADYVLHVDPWWNPAVEDQATGRAHRMGQTRPVTVYRFCTRGTIEAKILALHDRKRELAEDLLAGMGERKKLDLAELRELLSAG